MAPSCFNMSSYWAIWTHFTKKKQRFSNKYISWNSYIWTSRFPENWSLFVGRPFFRKPFASKNYAERYRRNMLGPNFQKHLLFQFQDPWALASQFSAFEKCIFHFCTIRLKPVALQVFTAPIFLEALNLWVRCSRLFFPQKKGPHIFGSPWLVGTLPKAVFSGKG